MKICKYFNLYKQLLVALSQYFIQKYKSTIELIVFLLFQLNQKWGKFIQMTSQFLYGNNTQEKALMMSISQTQDLHGSFKVSYSTMHIKAIWSCTLISTKCSILIAVFSGVSRVFGILVCDIPSLIFWELSEMFRKCL